MMASVRYHFGVLRTAKEQQQQCSASGLHQQQESDETTNFSLEDYEDGIVADGYSTILGSSNTTENNGHGPASHLLMRMRPADGQEHDNDDDNDVGWREEDKRKKKPATHHNSSHQQQKATVNGMTKQKLNVHKNGGVTGSERSRGPTRLRNSASKCSSLLTDEVELDDDVEEEDEVRHSGGCGSDEDEDDLLPTSFSMAMANGFALQGLGQNGVNGAGGGNNTPWHYRFRRRLKLLGGCCFPMRRTAGGGSAGFTQFQ